MFHGALALALGEGAAILDAPAYASRAAALKARNGRGWIGMGSRCEIMTLTQGPAKRLS